MKDRNLGKMTGFFFDLWFSLIEKPKAMDEKIACAVLVAISIGTIVANCIILL